MGCYDVREMAGPSWCHNMNGNIRHILNTCSSASVAVHSAYLWLGARSADKQSEWRFQFIQHSTVVASKLLFHRIIITISLRNVCVCFELIIYFFISFLLACLLRFFSFSYFLFNETIRSRPLHSLSESIFVGENNV